MKKTHSTYLAHWIWSLFVVVSLVLFPTIVCAAMEDVLSMFQVYAVVDETYDSNVNLTPRNEKDDFITTLSLGVRFSTLPKSETTGEFQQPSATEETQYGIKYSALEASRSSGLP